MDILAKQFALDYLGMDGPCICFDQLAGFSGGHEYSWRYGKRKQLTVVMIWMRHYQQADMQIASAIANLSVIVMG
ncbi:MAG: hypothetical protein HYR68_06310 [Burkholderiales bacterium]|nr:hypothetical protein [Burkholderiales bacterium]MBI3730205.1 hypothetical protein [Burkholderiales bacterium]